MRRHLLGVFQRAAIGEVGRDPGRPKRMITDRRENANRPRRFRQRSRLPRFRVFPCPGIMAAGDWSAAIEVCRV